MKLASWIFGLVTSAGLLCCAAQPAPLQPAPSSLESRARDVVSVSGPSEASNCSIRRLGALTWEMSSVGKFVPLAVRSRPASWDEPERSEVEIAGGALVAVDRGEFAGSGLFWLAEGTETMQPVEGARGGPIRRIFQTRRGPVGVVGLCHGGGPFVTTLVRLQPTSSPTLWESQGVAQVNGCPAAATYDASSDAVVIATAEGDGLVSTSPARATVIATWPPEYHPKELHVSPPDPAGEVTVYVGFGQTLAAFRAGQSWWYTLRGCVGGVGE